MHIIAGNPDYENTDRILRLGSNWPIVGAGNRFATYPGVEGNYTVGGNITIDTYENVWSWDKGVDPTTDHDKWYDIPEIYGASVAMLVVALLSMLMVLMWKISPVHRILRRSAAM